MFRDLYIEIFAIMLPGISFLVLFTLAIMVPLYDLLGNYTDTNSAVLVKNIDTHAGVIVSLSLVAAYVLGQMLFRSDPKFPDQLSIRTHWWQRKRGSCVEIAGKGRDEYPYHALKVYLETRGMYELSDYVTWHPDDWLKPADSLFDNARHRSKHFINQLKLRIKSVDDRLFFEIARNETHIRLMSSLWWMSLYMLFFVLVGVGISWKSFLESVETYRQLYYHTHHAIMTTNQADADMFRVHVRAMTSPYLALSISLFTIYVVNTFIHYQRVREIVFVLETYHMIRYRYLLLMGRRAFMDELIYGTEPE